MHPCSNVEWHNLSLLVLHVSFACTKISQAFKYKMKLFKFKFERELYQKRHVCGKETEKNGRKEVVQEFL